MDTGDSMIMLRALYYNFTELLPTGQVIEVLRSIHQNDYVHLSIGQNEIPLLLWRSSVNAV